MIGINPTKKYDVNPNNRASILIKMINDCNVNCNNNIQVQGKFKKLNNCIS